MLCDESWVQLSSAHHSGRDQDLPGPGPGSQTFRKFWQVPDAQPIFQAVGLHGSCSTLRVGLCK